MKKTKKSSPSSFKQTKISAFCIKKEDVSRKRRLSDENQQPKMTSSNAEPSPKKCKPSGVLQQQNKIEFDDFDFGDFFDELTVKSPAASELDFSEALKCFVLDTKTEKSEQVLTLKDEKSGKIGTCKLRDVWMYFKLDVNDVVFVKAMVTSEGWVVDGKNGYVSIHPDIIVSSTALVGAMFCRRRGVLSSFFRGFDRKNKAMVMGSLVHEILQRALRMKSCTLDDINACIDELMTTPQLLRDLYSSDLKLEASKTELKAYAPKIKHFLDVYVTKEVEPSGNNFKGSIIEVLDVEESVTAPKLGFTGRIDATVKVRCDNKEKVMPLEIKTGRASFSNEHKNQVALYTIMMSERGQKVDAGLLLYIKDGIMEEVKPNSVEIRDLIYLRNELVKYLKSFRTFTLPEPIRFANACSKCPYLTICNAYLTHDGLDELSSNHPMRTMDVPQIKPTHVNYFIRWSRLVCLEDENNEVRLSIEDLKLENEGIPFKSEFRHVFHRCSQGASPLPGSWIIVSSGSHSNIASGKLINVTSDQCSVLLNKQLTDLKEDYRVEQLKTSSIASRYFTNLGHLLEEQNAGLREIIIDKKPPSFNENFDKKILNAKCVRILKPLNKEQQRAVLKALTMKDYLLIRGPPGTGKTQTIVAIVNLLAALDHSVLITSHTHSSIDNVLLRLDDLDFLRLGSLKSIDERLHPRCFAAQVEKCKTVEDIAKLYDRKVMASTCLGLDDDVVSKKTFDFCIIDECSQVMQPEALKPLFCCKKFILIGDSNQLSPVVRNREARKLGMGESLFELLESDSAVVSLRKQYRMNRTVMDLANKITYEGGLECANDDVAQATLNLREPSGADEWICDILSTDIERAVVFVDTARYFEKNRSDGESCASKIEAEIIASLVSALIEYGVGEKDIGVVAPFRAQVELLRSKCHFLEFHNLEVSTVDQYQGRDKQVILFSCTKENMPEKVPEELELLNEQRRLTVALTRAKHKLIIVGDKRTVVKYKPFERLVAVLGHSQIFELKHGEKGFSWERLLTST